ncbi:hypothetical protein [Methanobrevibacter sp.]|uniref:hypothetical protein n=1 Tax=Methanobrevibacter sp. TaxID=66852 RepID=UPI0025F6F611|nr:hypothetical protein [Methanobrevibacter sp.]MBR4447954.1 hypothetical protein [Methanobrevibacter sp.]
MEFIVNNKKYSILNHELYVDYIMVESYFKDYSKYDYDIHFDFLDYVLNMDKVTFEDILEATKYLEELIEKGEINFTPPGLRIDVHQNESFKITYQTLEFENINVGEAIPLMIALTSLLNHKPVISLYQIEEELNYFLEKFRYYENID